MAIRHPGFSFQPTDEHLFFHYLLRRLNQEPLPDPDIIRDCDVYGGGDPWNIFNKDWDEKFYVFTVLKKKNKSKVDRTAGSGTWKGEQSHEIRDSRGKLVGYKKLFTFKPKASSNAEADKAKNGHWIMYEYSTHPHIDTECVLCVISNKYAGKAKKQACHNLHGRVRLEEENRLAKKARLLCYDHPNAVDDPSTTSLPSAPAATQAQLAAFPGFDEDAVFNPPPAVTPIVDFAGDAKLYSHPTMMTTVPKDILCTYDSLAFSGDMDTHWLPTTAMNVLQEDTRHITFPAFCGDANDVNSLPTTMTAAQQDTCDASSLAFGGPACLHPKTTMAVQNDIFYAADSQAFRCNGNNNLLPPAAANLQGDTCNEACWAFGGPSVYPLPTTSMEARGVDSECAHQLMNMEMDQSVDYQLTTLMSVLQENTRHTTFPAACSDANDVSSLLTTMTAVQQDTCGASSLAFGGTTCLNPTATMMAVQNDIFYAADSQAFCCNGNTNLLPPASANMQGDTCNEACWAFGGPSADPLPMTSMAAQGIDSQWVHQLMNLEIDPFDDYLFHTVVNQPARALNAWNDLVEAHPEGVPANWPVEFLDFGNCI